MILKISDQCQIAETAGAKWRDSGVIETPATSKFSQIEEKISNLEKILAKMDKRRQKKERQEKLEKLHKPLLKFANNQLGRNFPGNFRRRLLDRIKF